MVDFWSTLLAVSLIVALIISFFKPRGPTSATKQEDNSWYDPTVYTGWHDPIPKI